MSLDIASTGERLSARVDFHHLGDRLGTDVRAAVEVALEAGAVFPGGTDPLEILRSTVDTAVRDIEADRRGRLVQRLLLVGPYEGEEPSTSERARGRSLSKEETERAVNFIYGFMVNTFKGELTELLATGACARLLDELRRERIIPRGARLYSGRSVLISAIEGRGASQGADLHVLVVAPGDADERAVTLVGVAEVKSGAKSRRALGRQLDGHINRACGRGLIVGGASYSPEQLTVGMGGSGRVVRVTVQPGDWVLPRTLRYVATAEGRQLVLDPAVPPTRTDDLRRLGDLAWHVRLRWSKEAIAAVGYEMALWYVGMVGEVIYGGDSDGGAAKPPGWDHMNPIEAGQNAAKMMLYYALRPYAVKDEDGTLTRRERRMMGRMIALYNTFGFGYALGMNFRVGRRRQMLWPEDLEELATTGRTKNGGRLVGSRPPTGGSVPGDQANEC